MDYILLRTFTEKSLLPEGKYKFQPVSKIILLDPEYLQFEYYCYSRISFSSSVLDSLGILPEYRIKKPGKDPVMYKEFKKHLWHGLNSVEFAQKVAKIHQAIYHRLKEIQLRDQRDDIKDCRKGSLQKINQGKSNRCLGPSPHI
jgi:hypothetical protein